MISTPATAGRASLFHFLPPLQEQLEELSLCHASTFNRNLCLLREQKEQTRLFLI